MCTSHLKFFFVYPSISVSMGVWTSIVINVAAAAAAAVAAATATVMAKIVCLYLTQFWKRCAWNFYGFLSVCCVCMYVCVVCLHTYVCMCLSSVLVTVYNPAILLNFQLGIIFCCCFRFRFRLFFFFCLLLSTTFACVFWKLCWCRSGFSGHTMQL